MYQGPIVCFNMAPTIEYTLLNASKLTECGLGSLHYFVVGGGTEGWFPQVLWHRNIPLWTGYQLVTELLIFTN